MKLLDRYVLKCHLGPFLFGFGVITGVLALEVFKNFLDDFLAKGISAPVVLEVLVLSLGHTIALSIPMAVLVATLMAFGQLAGDNEITALRAAGVHLYRVMLPAVLASLVVCAGMVAFNHYVLPESNHRLASLTSDIGRKRPTVNIEPGRFVDDFKGYQLLIGSKDERTDEVRDVQVYVLNPGRHPDILVAPRGRLHFEDGGATLYVDLYDGEMHSMPEVEGAETGYRVSRFPAATIVIPEVGDHLQRTDRQYRGDREMNINMMYASIADKEKQIEQIESRLGEQARDLVQLKLGLLDAEQRATYFATHRPLPPGKLTLGSEERLRDTLHMESVSIEAYLKQIRALQVEIHKKFSIPVACVVFVLLGAPLAIRSGRSGMTMAIGLSIACFFVYYLFLTYGEKLADREWVSPILAMWAGNIFFGILALWLAWRTSTETTVINWQRLDPRRLRPFRWRTAA